MLRGKRAANRESLESMGAEGTKRRANYYPSELLKNIYNNQCNGNTLLMNEMATCFFEDFVWV